MKNEIQSCMYIWAVRDPNTWCAVNTFGILAWQVFFQAYNIPNPVLMCLIWLPKEKEGLKEEYPMQYWYYIAYLL